MTKLIDKAGILSVCLVIYFIYSSAAYMIIPFLLVVIISALNSYFEEKTFVIGSMISYSITAMFIPDMIYFIPLMGYDCFREKYAPGIFILLIPLIASYRQIPETVLIILFALTFISYIIKYHTNHLEKLRVEYINLRDDMVEFSRTLEEKNTELMEKQDYEVNLATLNERNRIAREIHDSVGHVMSSAILQVGALMATAADESVKANLSDLNETLSAGMTRIRKSVHDLYDDSIDLQVQLQKMINDFPFCPITFDYDMGEMRDTKITYAIIAIVREALANIMKHSNANRVTLTVREHPGLYQVIVSDNGTQINDNLESGMGLNNIRTRIEGLKGIFTMEKSSGFKLFISIPKEVKQ